MVFPKIAPLFFWVALSCKPTFFEPVVQTTNYAPPQQLTPAQIQENTQLRNLSATLMDSYGFWETNNHNTELASQQLAQKLVPFTPTIEQLANHPETLQAKLQQAFPDFYPTLTSQDLVNMQAALLYTKQNMLSSLQSLYASTSTPQKTSLQLVEIQHAPGEKRGFFTNLGNPIEATYKRFIDDATKAFQEIKDKISVDLRSLTNTSKGMDPKKLPGSYQRMLKVLVENYISELDFISQVTLAKNFLQRGPTTPEQKIGIFLLNAGPTLQKVAQTIAGEIQDPTLQNELKSLLSFDAFPYDPEIERERILQEITTMGIAKDSPLFQKFEKANFEPLKAGTVGFVVKATLDPKTVEEKTYIIKVRRDDVIDKFNKEKILLTKLFINDAQAWNIVQTFMSDVQAEFDFSNEARNLVTARTIYEQKTNHLKVPRVALLNPAGEIQFQKDKDYSPIPETHKMLASQQMLIEELVPGVPLTSYVDFPTDGSLSRPVFRKLQKARIAQIRARIPAVMEHSARWIGNACFGTGFYQKDGHPGNILFDETNNANIAYEIDMGASGVLPARYQQASFLFMVGSFGGTIPLIGPRIDTTKHLLTAALILDPQLANRSEDLEFLKKQIPLTLATPLQPGEMMGAKLGDLFEQAHMITPPEFIRFQRGLGYIWQVCATMNNDFIAAGGELKDVPIKYPKLYLKIYNEYKKQIKEMWSSRGTIPDLPPPPTIEELEARTGNVLEDDAGSVKATDDWIASLKKWIGITPAPHPAGVIEGLPPSSTPPAASPIRRNSLPERGRIVE